MMEKRFRRIRFPRGWPARLRWGLGLLIGLLTAHLGWTLWGPASGAADEALEVADVVAGGRRERPASGPHAEMALFEGRRMFQPAIPLPSRQVANQSVERIKDLLSLKAITRLNRQPVAYIKIKDVGLKSFRQGEGIEGLFTVTRIDEKIVELEIVGERIQMEL